MFDKVFPFLIQYFSRIVNFIFNLPIDTKYNITLGQFLLTIVFIGIVVYFIFGSDFFPGHINTCSNSIKNSNDGYQPRHAPGTAGKDFSTRESRHRY